MVPFRCADAHNNKFLHVARTVETHKKIHEPVGTPILFLFCPDQFWLFHKLTK